MRLPSFQRPLGAVAVVCLVLSGCIGSIDDPPTQGRPLPPSAAPPYEPASPALRRLTAEQYRSAVRDAFGDEVVVTAPLAGDLRVAGLVAVGAGRATASAADVGKYEAAARQTVDQVFETPATFERLVPCDLDGEVDRSCAEMVAQRLAPALYRRTLSGEEIRALSNLVDDVAEAAAEAAVDADPAPEQTPFEIGLRSMVSAMLQSPNFLFRADGGPDEGGVVRFDGPTMASRLSYFLWNEGPDDALRDAAADGSLLTDEGLTAQFDRMWADPRARHGIRAFYTDMFDLVELLNKRANEKDTDVYPHAVAEFASSAREETLRFLEFITFEGDYDYRDIMTSELTFVDPLLASLYAVPAPTTEGFGQVTLPESSRRRGILGHASVLAMNSHSVNTSSTLRGRFLREVLLCGSVPNPPAGVDTDIPEPDENSRTLRDRIGVHLESPVCASCHNLMDPVGLAFEQFDAVGGYRTIDNGAEILPHGEWAGVEFADSYELTALLRDDPDLPQCLVRTVFRYASGREERPRDTEALRELLVSFETGEYRVRALMLATILHPTFREAAIEETSP